MQHRAQGSYCAAAESSVVRQVNMTLQACQYATKKKQVEAVQGVPCLRQTLPLLVRCLRDANSA
eukprot:m.164786 g.164786  ORF g.164786 m.164786 type:complete len:64 (+) comp14660_c0_seq6:2389-2580(+)